MLKKLLLAFLLFCLPLLPTAAAGEDFCVTTGFDLTRRKGKVSYSVKVDFPVSGNRLAVREIKRWLCEWLDTVPPHDLDEAAFGGVMQKHYEAFLRENGEDGGHIAMELCRSYEDERVVTYEMTCKEWGGGATTREEDCVSVSKRDGHRLQPSEVFRCGEGQVKQLMWKWRDGLPVEGLQPRDLVVGNVAFTDGWVVVIGPANGYIGAAYRIRFQDAEPYLRGE